MTAPPPRRRDNRCYVCLQPLKPPSRFQKGIDRKVYDQEPFCSSACARAWYGTQLGPAQLGRPAA